MMMPSLGKFESSILRSKLTDLSPVWQLANGKAQC
jgi:hypothetical protein